jgi:DNA modification methylase
MAKILHGDALTELRQLADASIDALVTDPPAGIGFMGKEWDTPEVFPIRARGGRSDGGGQTGFAGGVTRNSSPRGRDGFIGMLTPVFAQCLRVLKPGAHGLVWALPRTSHWTATALEDAGFEVRDVVTHHFGSGFPKSLDVSKAIDKDAGIWRGRAPGTKSANGSMSGPNYERSAKGTGYTAAAAAAWDGWGTALKPASEHWILVRKPFRGNVAANVLEHGTGALNIDGCRIACSDKTPFPVGAESPDGAIVTGLHSSPRGEDSCPDGRWPANLILSHAANCADQCGEGCPVAELDRQSGDECGAFAPVLGSEPSRPAKNAYGEFARGGGIFYGDTGGASRFFYVAKPATGERDIGLEGLGADYDHSGPRGHDLNGDGTPRPRPRGNIHPTVKPVELMRYLCRLITPPKGTIVDPFMGSGTTGIAALREGFDFIGIEQEAEYVEIAKQRIRGDCPLFNVVNQ